MAAKQNHSPTVRAKTAKSARKVAKAGVSEAFKSVVWSEALKSEYDKAKQLSDFIGMLMRLSFVLLAAIFFWYAAKSEPDWFISRLLYLCSIYAIVLYALMIWRVMGLITCYLNTDADNVKSFWIKLLIISLGWLHCSVATYGIFKLSYVVAEKSNILH